MSKVDQLLAGAVDLSKYEERTRMVSGEDFGTYDISPESAFEKFARIRNNKRRKTKATDDPEEEEDIVMPDYADGTGETVFQIEGPLGEWIEKNDFEQDSDDGGESLVQKYNSKQSMAGLTVENIVTGCNTETAVNCNLLVAHGMAFGMKYNPRRYAAIVWRHRNPNATTLIFPTGVIITTGAKTLKDSFIATKHAVDFIRTIRDGDSLPIYRDIRVKTVKVNNFVAKTFLFFFVDLKKLCQLNFVRYHEQEFTGAIMILRDMDEKYKHRAITVLVFSSGAVVFTGTTSRKEIIQVYNDVFPYLAQCSVTDEPTILQMSTSDQKLRVAADLKRAKTKKRSLIRLDPKAQESKFSQVIGNAVREKKRLGQGVDVTTISRAVGASSDVANSGRHIMTVERKSSKSAQASARNAIAVRSMRMHEKKKEQERALLRESLRANAGSALQGSIATESSFGLPAVTSESAARKKATKPTSTKSMSIEESFALIKDTYD